MTHVVFESSEFIFSEVGTTNAFKYGGPRTRLGHFNGIANTYFKKQKFPSFESDTIIFTIQ